MVAISLYKGNLHKVPDVPRTWLMPQRKISLRDFKTLVRRRNIALSRNVSSAVAGTTTITTTTTTVVLTVSDNPNPNPNNNSDTGIREPESEVLLLKEEGEEGEEEEEEVEEGNTKKPVAKAEVDQEAGAERGSELEGGAGPGKLTDLVAVEIKPQVEDHNTVVENEVKIVLEDCQVKMDGKKDGEILLQPNIEVQESNKMTAESSIDNRKKDVEEKLRILKEKKHGLVQVLKQILNAEEELKRRSTQGMTGRSSVPLHVDIPNDTGSVTRLATPRMGSDGILTGEEGGEPDGMSNHQNADGLHSLRLSSQSPSSDFQNKKPANNVIPNSARTGLGLIGSPSCFAVTPTVQQGHPSNLPTLTVSGTSYIASSPSPAASGGTSVFRESQIPSPWN